MKTPVDLFAEVEAALNTPLPDKLDCREPSDKELELLNEFSMQKNTKDLPIDRLNLTVRAFNCLCSAGIWTIRLLSSQTPSQLMAIPNFGEKSLRNVQAKLGLLGLSLKEDGEESTMPRVRKLRLNKGDRIVLSEGGEEKKGNVEHDKPNKIVATGKFGTMRLTLRPTEEKGTVLHIEVEQKDGEGRDYLEDGQTPV